MSSYCQKCGNELSDGTRYCPVCGFDSMSQGSVNNNNSGSYNNGPQYNNSQNQGSSGTLNIIMGLGILWAICIIIWGILLFTGGSIAGDDFTQSVGIGGGVVCLASGLIALISCVLIYKQENYQIASILCLIGSILALVTGIFTVFIGFVAGIIGIVFFILMMKEKSRFKS